MISKQEKRILFSAFAVALAAVAGMTAYNSQKVETLSELAMENVDALAGGESGVPCGGPKTSAGCASQNTVNCRDLYGCQ